MFQFTSIVSLILSFILGYTAFDPSTIDKPFLLSISFLFAFVGLFSGYILKEVK